MGDDVPDAQVVIDEPVQKLIDKFRLRQHVHQQRFHRSQRPCAPEQRKADSIYAELIVMTKEYFIALADQRFVRRREHITLEGGLFDAVLADNAEVDFLR